MRRTITLLLAALLLALPAATAQEPDAQQPVAPEGQPPDDPGEPDEPADDFQDDGPIENIQEDPSDPGGHVSWWGPYLFAVVALGAVLLFVFMRRARRRDL